MNLAQATDFAGLLNREQEVPKKIKTADEIAEFVFAQAEEKQNPFLYMMPEDWKKRWLPSKKFVLMNVPLSCAAAPCDAKDREWVLTRIHAKATHPVVIDTNKNKVGKSKHGYVPPVIVLDGKHRFQAAALRGDSHILAWVGEDAAVLINEQLERMKAGSKKTGEVQRIAASTTFEHSVKLSVAAGGPGSGRHPEAGSFKFTGSSDVHRGDGTFKGTSVSYEGKKGTSVQVNRRPFEGAQHDVRTFVTENSKKVHDGSESSATRFVRDRYGINYKK